MPRKREVMPVTHAAEVVEGIFVSRLDDLFLGWIRTHNGRFRLHEDELLELLQSIQFTFFPRAFGDGPGYTADPAGRVASEQPNPVGLVPRKPTTCILARAMLAEERQRAAGKLKTADGEHLLADDDLAVLRSRREQREARQASAV